MQEESRESVFPTYEQRLQVAFDYPVHFTRGVFNSSNPLLAEVLDRREESRCHRACVYIDSGVASAHPALIQEINEYFHERSDHIELAAPPQIVPGGEDAKTSWEPVRDVMWTLGNLHLDRQSYVLAVGGGSVLDMVGFATSIVHRGLRLVRLPTTTLAQNDAGVGVKNGMNEHGQKNFVGTFAPPFAVINDFSFLPTLSFEQWIAGVAEAFKVAIIKDSSLFELLCERASRLRARESRSLEEVIHRCAVLHLEHIRTGGDPFELGSSRPLDFGHWAAHRIEILSKFAVGHGQAVSVGVALDSYYAMRKGLIPEADLERILEGLEGCGLPVYVEFLGWRGKEGQLLVLDGLRHFQEHLGGQLTVTLPDGIGRRLEVHQVDPDLVAEAVAFLEAR